MDKFYLCLSVYMNSPAHGTHLAQSRSKHVAIVEQQSSNHLPHHSCSSSTKHQTTRQQCEDGTGLHNQQKMTTLILQINASC